MKTLKTLKEVKEIEKEDNQEVYVRYSRNHEADIERGYSLNHQTGEREPGLSANRIDQDAEDYKILKQLTEYEYTRQDGKSYGWICVGRRIGTDSDGAPTIEVDRVVGKVGLDLQKEGNVQDKIEKKKAEHDIKEAKQKLEKIKSRGENYENSTAIKIWKEQLESAQQKLQEV